MSNKVWAGSPSFSASAKPSHTAIIEAARIMLLQILAVWPLPAGPAWTIVFPIALRIGSARAKAAASPPTIKVSVPASAPMTPPETGASSIAKPAFVAERGAGRTDEVVAGHMVLGLHQIGRHRRTHITEPDKADRRHSPVLH